MTQCDLVRRNRTTRGTFWPWTRADVIGWGSIDMIVTLGVQRCRPIIDTNITLFRTTTYFMYNNIHLWLEKDNVATSQAHINVFFRPRLSISPCLHDMCLWHYFCQYTEIFYVAWIIKRKFSKQHSTNTYVTSLHINVCSLHTRLFYCILKIMFIPHWNRKTLINFKKKC